ncbi:hypothetical protein [Streptomyces sp. H34-S4]|uniref:hypothetical protein n=1 Tax=Streptomyces sp. H34-S4 TaxID=2996463 RepID=UPI002271178E|nr:hypothetical protein [Streptomyces sp. H34-S4]MCY0935869.1 hypothetical protein [Streptomyces sp. H34-S4]
MRDFLVANPVLAEGANGTLEAVYFHDAERPARTEYSAKSPGVERVRRIDLDDFLEDVPKGTTAPNPTETAVA